MDIKVIKSEIGGTVQIPPSKSVAHRKMIAAALSGAALNLNDGGNDIFATARCLETLSPFIKAHLGVENGLEDSLCLSDKNDLPILNAGESGSTLRFLLPIVCALGVSVVFDGEGRLKDRPLGGLVETLIARGAEIGKIGASQLPLKVGGKLTAGEFVIDGGVSSQYVTGLLFALPLLDGDSNIVIDGELVSRQYVDITLGVLAEFGIKIKPVDNGYFVAGNQRYMLSSNLTVEGDWSSAGFMLALGVLAGEVRLKGLNMHSLQGDKVAVELLKKAGADIAFCDGDLVAHKSELCAIDFDAKDCPDAVPIMATALSFAKGDSHISHVDRLRDKESDRLSAVREMLGAFGIDTEYCDDVLTVRGGTHHSYSVDSFNDHRMAMSATVCALATEGESVIHGIGCIDKSYPGFLKDIAQLGAKVSTL